MKKVINWGLVGTGGITNKFLTGLKAAEGGNAAAIVSRSQESADAFAAKNGIPKAYADYDAMLAHPDIDVIYIGIPHPWHKEYALKAFKAGKAVLCEKPVCINAGELSELIKAAREKRVFFMEAMWTRFVPPLCKVREWIAAGRIGDVKMMEANFGFRAAWKPEARLLNSTLGGGSLLDAGVYPISLASMVFGGKQPEKIAAFLHIGETGVDEEFSGFISYGGSRVATVSSAVQTAMTNDAWIYGDKGRIHIPNFVFARSAELIIDGPDEKSIIPYEPVFVSNGYNFEADEVMNCLREGKTESEIMPLDESLQIVRIMDEIRAQWNFRYPSESR
jgi:predicted dehydrogenase